MTRQTSRSYVKSSGVEMQTYRKRRFACGVSTADDLDLFAYRIFAHGRGRALA